MNYDLMESAVAEMCKSLENDPGRWSIGTCTLEDTRTGIEYWLHEGRIHYVWNGRSQEQVFSEAQGRKIWASYEKLRSAKASSKQQSVLSAFLTPADKPKGSLSFLLKLLEKW